VSIENTETAKPLPCHQKWDDMTPTDCGRICHGCGKVVHDFRKISWNEIENIHRNSPIPVCAIYSEEQLNSWGHEVVDPAEFSSVKFLMLSSALIAFTQFQPDTLYAQEKSPQEHVQTGKQKPPVKNLPVQQKKRIISGTVVILNPDSTKRPAKDITLYVFEDSTHLRATTDSAGRFAIDITSRFSRLPNNLSLIVTHPDISTRSFLIKKGKLKSIDILLKQANINSYKIPVISKGYPTFYYAQPPDSKDSREINKRKKRKWWPWNKNKESHSAK
jgi:hypothetical protein